MKHTYPYVFVDGHIIAMTGRSRLLIDTGATSSFADASPLDFAGRRHRVPQTHMGASARSLSESVGTPLDGLVGADIVNRYDMFIDPTTHTLTMSEDALPLAGQSLAVDNVAGIPIIVATVRNTAVRMFFDTGAKLSYLDPRITCEFQSMGMAEDFYPGVGNFTTQVYDIPIMLGAENIMVRVGNLPPILQTSLMKANTGGILGTVILQTHKVTLAQRRNTMTIQKIPQDR